MGWNRAVKQLFSLGVVISVSLVLLVSQAAASAEEHEDDRGMFAYRPATDLRDAAHVMTGREAAPWMPRVLDILQAPRGPSYRLDQVALFDGEGGQPYLVLTWSYGRRSGDFHSHMKNVIEFYRVSVDQQGRVLLTTMREIWSWSAELVWPSGEEVFPGEPTLAVVDFSGGGSGPENSGYRLIQLKRNTVDITPDAFGRTHGFRDIDNDGVFEVVVHDMRWKSYFDSRGAAGPYVGTILERRDGAFVPACSEHINVYERRIVAGEAWLAEDKGWPYEVRAGILLDNLQIGELADARVAYDQLREDTRPNHSQYVRGEAEVVADFGPVLEAAELLAEEPCVLAAMTPDLLGDSSFARPSDYQFSNWLPPRLQNKD